MAWAVDYSHSTLDFSVRHLGIAAVRGRFKKFAVAVDDGERNTLRGVTVTIDAASVDTGEPQRDQHLRSADFLDAERYPEIRFASTAVSARGEGRYLVTGGLTIRDQTHEVTFEVELTGPMKDPWGNLRSGATGQGTLHRKEWGLTWNKALEVGGWLVGDDVRFSFDVEAVAKVPAAP